MAISNVRAANIVRNLSSSKFSFKGNTLNISLGSSASQLRCAPKASAGKNLYKLA